MLDRDYALLVGSYSDMDALAHQPYAPVPGKGIYGMTLGSEGTLSLNHITEALNPAVTSGRPDNGIAACENTDLTAWIYSSAWGSNKVKSE